jgi:hypothetical protein
LSKHRGAILVSQIQYFALPPHYYRSTRAHSVSKMQSITNITTFCTYCYHGVWKYKKTFLHSAYNVYLDSVLFTYNSVLFTYNSVLFTYNSVLFTYNSVLFTYNSVLFTYNFVLFTYNSTVIFIDRLKSFDLATVPKRPRCEVQRGVLMKII